MRTERPKKARKDMLHTTRRASRKESSKHADNKDILDKTLRVKENTTTHVRMSTKTPKGVLHKPRELKETDRTAAFISMVAYTVVV